MKDIWKVTFVIIGTIIGAGFASGQEIYLFFNRYGPIGMIGMAVSCIFTSFLIYKIFCILQKKEIDNYGTFLEKINKNEKINKIIQVIIQVFLLISFYIMIAGMSAYFKQEFGISTWICSGIMALCCYLVLQRDIKGVMWLNNLLIPCLILFIFYLGFKNWDVTALYFQNLDVDIWQFPHWLISSVLYASYNSILLIPMLIELKPYISSKSKAKRTSIICSILLTLVGICLFCLLANSGNYVQEIELPMLEITKQFGRIYPYFYGGVIVVAIFTSAIAAGYGFLKNQIAIGINSKKEEERKYKKWLIGICLFAPVIADFGFSNLVSSLYPIFGVLGLLQIYAIFRTK